MAVEDRYFMLGRLWGVAVRLPLLSLLATLAVLQISCAASVAPPPARPAHLAPRIFVYDLPEALYSGSNERCEQSQFCAETVLLSEVGKAGYVTEDASAADYFWVRVNLFCSDGRPLGLKQAGQRLTEAIQYIRTNWPYFDANEGRDHIFVFFVQARVCSSPAFDIPELRNSIVLTHWKLNHPRLHCALPGHHVVVPTPFHDKYLGMSSVWQQPSDRGSRMRIPGASRRIHLLAMRVKDNPKVVTDLEAGADSFLEGVAYRVANLLHAKYLHQYTQPAEWSKGHIAKYQESNFCLVSLNNLGIQLKLSILTGCIPIFLEEEGMAWKNLLPYEEFSVSKPFENIFELPLDLATLRHNTTQMEEMRGTLSCMQRFMTWRGENALAVQMLMCDLRLRKDPMARLSIDMHTCSITCQRP